jgi:hypothetical protein
MLQIYIDCYTISAAHTIGIRKIVSQVGFSGIPGLLGRWVVVAGRHIGPLSTVDLSLGE